MYTKPARRATQAGLVVTDDAGRLTQSEAFSVEPECGSIVLTEGDHGTAWQRQYSTGLWQRCAGGRARTWDWLLSQRRVRLVYDAPARETSEGQS